MESASCVTFPEGDSEVPAAGVFDHENPPLSVTEKAVLCHICRFGGRDDPRFLIQKWPGGYVRCITQNVMPLGKKGGFAVSTVQVSGEFESQEGQVPKGKAPKWCSTGAKESPIEIAKTRTGCDRIARQKKGFNRSTKTNRGKGSILNRMSCTHQDMHPNENESTVNPSITPRSAPPRCQPMDNTQHSLSVTPNFSQHKESR